MKTHRGIVGSPSLRRWGGLAGVALAGAVAVTGCGSNNNAGNGAATAGSQDATGAGCRTATLTGAGSSFQAPMEQAWSAAYLAQCPQTHVNYNSVGSGAGIQQFGQGTVDFAGSDVTMKPAEQQAADSRCAGPAIHLPVTAGGVAVAYNVPGVTGLRLSAGTIAGIFQGSITRWDDPAIKADNPSANLPGLPVVVFHRSDGSGTTAVFSAYLQAAAGSSWKLGADKTLTWPVGQGAKGNEGVSAGVNQTKGGITYTEQAFAQQHKLTTALVKNAGGSYVELTSANVSKALESAKPAGAGNDVKVTVDYQPTAADAYPISTVSYVIVCSRYSAQAGKDKVAALKSYLDYAISTGQQAAAGLGFAPLPEQLVTSDRAAIAAISAG